MLFLLGWIIYGFLVGTICKWIHPEEDMVGIVPTVSIGIAGSYIGGFINWLIGMGDQPFSSSGLFMGIVGGLLFCWIYRIYRIKNFVKAQGRMPLMKMRK